ncbi:MAG: riboflavin synthase [Thermodesulfobacteriota bacterium]
MFTGIIQGLGRIAVNRPRGGEIALTVEAEFDWTESLAVGESISVSGVCLTVTEHRGRSFSTHVSAETVSRSDLSRLRPGARVNLERAMRLSDRLGGHLVTGHVDGLGSIKEVREKDRSLVFTIVPDQALIRLIIEKGSVAVDGISLTVNEVLSDAFTVNVIPHTAGVTTLGFKKQGDYVNLETDLIGKYVARLLGFMADEGPESKKSKLDEKFLAEHGFI